MHGHVRSHILVKRSPGLKAIVGRTLIEECAVDSSSGILIGVSGGPDSMALLTVLAQLAPQFGYRLSACGVDHGLRPEAAQELDVAETYCRALGVAFCRRSVVVAGISNIQAQARDARYKALAECAAELDLPYIATAHHQEDRAETVLLRLLRGAGPHGLAVLAAKQGNRLRPMIRAARATVRAYAHEHRVPHVDDPSNHNPRFLRVRVRHELLPLLRELSPGIIEHLCNIADELTWPSLPPVSGPDGDHVMLNRSQRAQLRRAIERRQYNTQIWLSDGRVITFDQETGEPQI
jgi:tRNA(Ile)-lysidine synthase